MRGPYASICILCFLPGLLLCLLLWLGPPPAHATDGGRQLAAEVKSVVKSLLPRPGSGNSAQAGLPGAEMRLAAALSRDGRDGVAAYALLDSPRQKRTLLRLMSLSGNPLYLAVIHQELGEGGAAINAALTAAAALGRAESAEFVRPYLRSGKAQRVVLALSYFTASPAAPGVGELQILLEWDDQFVRAALLRLLGRHFMPRYEPYCRKNLRDSRDLLRIPAVRCVGGGQGGMTPLVELFPSASQEAQLEIIATLSRHHPARSVPALWRWLGHRNRRVALAALIALQGLEDQTTVPHLMALIEKGGTALPNEVLIKSLGLFRDKRALPFLGKRLAIAQSSTRKIALMKALGDLGMMGGQEFLVNYLAHPAPALRLAARQALMRIAELQPPDGGAAGQ